MINTFRVDGVEYATASLSKEGQDLVGMLAFTQTMLQALNNQIALLTKAKNAYIADLKTEIIRGRTGVDLSTLFGDD